MLVAVAGWGVYSYTKSQSEIKTLESAKVVLQSKVEKGLAYAQALDLLLDPARKQAGLQTKQPNFSETELLAGLEEAIKATDDSKLQDNLVTMKKGGDAASMATILFMEHSVSAIVDTLK
ncbi:MAG: hypothetical protein M1127_02235 [Patescibacteria group bacterium]|nr:hypothetical protein [Patescibacteria group bacterium]